MNDTISRQAAIDAVEFGITYAKAINKSTGEVKELFKEGNKALNEAVERLKELPSAQPERIKGHWVEIASSNHTYKCSVCGRLLVNITDGKNNVAKNYPYCHCGADMRGEQE